MPKDLQLIEDRDYYIDPETNRVILTHEFLLKRGFCCHSKCRHCPYQGGAASE